MHRISLFAAACCLVPHLAQAEVPVVVTDIPPVHSLVAQVMGNLGSPVLLLEQGNDAHDFQLRPSQARALADAQIVFWIGPQMSPWLERARDIAPDAESISLLEVPGTLLHEYAESGGHDDDDAADHDSDTTEPASLPPGQPLPEAEHGHTGVDPHAWLNPTNAAIWLGRIADALSAEDPGNSVAYRANASLAQTSIAALETDIRQRLSPVKDQPIIVAHDALGYFADSFGLTIAGKVSDGHAATPGAGHLSEIRAMLEGGSVTCIFPEVFSDVTRIINLAKDTPTRVGAPLDPEGRAIAPGPALYETLLVNLATALSDCSDAK